MNAKQYLKKIRIYDTKINNLMRVLDNLKELAQATGGIDYAKDRVISSPAPDPMAERVIRIVEAEEELNEMTDRLIDLKLEAVKKINMLENPQHVTLLCLRYLEYRNWPYIADKMGYTTRWVYKLHGRALQEFQKYL